jgi:hypothetical protein
VVQHTREVYLKQNLVDRASVSNKTLYLGKHKNMIKCFKEMPVTLTKEIRAVQRMFRKHQNRKNLKNQ